jgi:hypothetical protein
MKRCHKCGKINFGNALWCNKCNTKLQDDISKPKEDLMEFDDSRKIVKKIAVVLITFIIISSAIVVYLYSTKGPDFEGISCKINEDFWFEEDKLITSDGWTFTMTKVMDYTLDGRVLALKIYQKNDIPFRPINTFSPIDLYIGIDNVKNNPENYPITITSFKDRYVWADFNGESSSDWEYFKLNVGNNHIIPHNQEVLNELNNISELDCVLIDGSLIDLYGTKGDQYYHWNTDTNIGDFNCEIILVDSLTIYS